LKCPKCGRDFGDVWVKNEDGSVFCVDCFNGNELANARAAGRTDGFRAGVQAAAERCAVRAKKYDKMMCYTGQSLDAEEHEAQRCAQDVATLLDGKPPEELKIEKAPPQTDDDWSKSLGKMFGEMTSVILHRINEAKLRGFREGAEAAAKLLERDMSDPNTLRSWAARIRRDLIDAKSPEKQ